ncbi:hypothetical protein WMF16_31980 [Sorangium sp. So ce388]
MLGPAVVHEPEVDDDDAPRRVDEDIARLEVAMDLACLMQCMHAERKLLHAAPQALDVDLPEDRWRPSRLRRHD